MWRRDGLTISTDPAHLDRDLIWRYLHDESYWAAGIPRDVMERSIAGSLNFGLFDGEPSAGAAQIGYSRVVTDGATFAWLCDVFVLPTHRGAGVARLLMDAVMAHRDLARVRNFMLATRDAHGLYAKYGFTPLTQPERWMAIRRPYR